MVHSEKEEGRNLTVTRRDSEWTSLAWKGRRAKICGADRTADPTTPLSPAPHSLISSFPAHSHCKLHVCPAAQVHLSTVLSKMPLSQVTPKSLHGAFFPRTPKWIQNLFLFLRIKDLLVYSELIVWQKAQNQPWRPGQG